MSEIWLKPHAVDDLARLSGFSLLRVDKVGRGGEEIGVYGIERRALCWRAASSPEQYCGQLEYMLVRISAAGQRPFLLVIVYRLPKLGFLVKNNFEKLLPSFPAAVILILI